MSMSCSLSVNSLRYSFFSFYYFFRDEVDVWFEWKFRLCFYFKLMFFILEVLIIHVESFISLFLFIASDWAFLQLFVDFRANMIDLGMKKTFY